MRLKKLMSLVLACAMALSLVTVASAADVVTVTKSVDFNNFTDLSEFTTISYLSGTDTANHFNMDYTFTFGAEEGNLAYNKLYNYGGAISLTGNKNTFAPTFNSSGNQTPSQLAITFPQAWEYREDKALVVQTGFIPVSTTATSTKWNQVNNKRGFIGGLLTTTDGTTDTNIVAPFNGMSWNPTANSVYLITGGQDFVGATGSEFGPALTPGQEANITTVIRPYDGLNSESKEIPDDKSLNIINNFDRSWDRARQTGSKQGTSYYHIDGGAAVKKVHGLYFSQNVNQQHAFTGYRMFEVSLNSADFTIKNKTFSDVATNGAVTIEFSQPISTNLSADDGVNSPEPAELLDEITVAPAGGEALARGTDYTIEVVEKSSGNTIWDAIVVTPVTAWAMDTQYTITLPEDIKNIARIGMADEDKTVVFTTEAPTEYTMTLAAYKGLAATGTELNAIEDGTTYFTVSATRIEGKAIANGTIKLVIKDASGNTVKSVSANKALGDGTSFGVAFKKLEAGMTATATIEAGGSVIATGSIN